MKRSVLSKTIGASVIAFNLAMLPLMPVAAQTNTTPGNSPTGSTTAPGSAETGPSTTPDDANLNINNTPADTTTGTGTTPDNSTPGTFTAPGDSTSGDNTTPGDTTTGISPAPSESPVATTPPQETASTRDQSSSTWGWLGLLGLIGLASLFRKPARSSAVGPTTSSDHSTGKRLHQGVAQAGVGLGNFVEELKTDVNNFKEHRAQEKEIKQIKNALGRPSTRVILDKQDNVILNVGDLITNKAIEWARSADMLDVLLDSVDEQKPVIAEEERTAPLAGEASLEEREQETIRNTHRQ